MLLGQIPIHILRDIVSKMWNAPLDSVKVAPIFFFVEVVGTIVDYHVLSASYYRYYRYKCDNFIGCSRV